ncbi:MAG: sugar ABC transporter permease [Spirochaetales bacterium]|nr:MAG: sugar ABC transporter permease [Spirochaetales bacterium]
MNRFIKTNIRAIARALSLWNVALAFASLTLLVALLLDTSVSSLARAIGAFSLALLAAISMIAATKMFADGKHARIWAFGVNYVAFLGVLLLCLQGMGFFLVIDRIAASFGKGFLSLLGLLTLLALRQWALGMSARLRDGKLFRRATALLLAANAAVFILQIDLVPALLGLFLNINTPGKAGLLGASILLALVCWILHSEPMQKQYKTTHHQSEAIAGLLFLTPNLLGFIVFFAGPLLLSLFMSFFRWDVLSPDPPVFIGLGNYLEIFSLSFARLADALQPLSAVMDGSAFSELTRFPIFGSWILVGARDALFWKSLGNTIAFALMAVPASVVLALVLAAILNSDIPGMKLFRILFFIPSIAAIVGVAMIWRWLYHGIIGYVNFGLSKIVDFLNLFLANDIVFENINWLSDPDIALFAIAIMAVWQTVGFNTVLFLAGLQNIPKSLYEASTIDGAGSVARFFHITIPLLAPTTFFVVATSTIQALQLFEQVYIATSNPEVINNSTLTVVFYLYQNGFELFRQGYASATAWALFLLIFVATFFQYRRQQAGENIY